MPEVLSSLRAALTDQAWTVRWNAVRAIASLEADESLVDVLRCSQPRDHSSVVARDFCLAVEALRTRDVPLPRELARYQRARLTAICN